MASPQRATFGSYIEQSVHEYIEARAARLNQKKSWAGAQIIQYWLDRGAPPLSEADKNMPPLSFDEFQQLQKLGRR